MPTPVVMPQMGESIAEGTIVRWFKKPGEKVDRDEPLFEISTDKVDAEIPAPVAGVLTEIRVREGETVPVNSVVAMIGLASERPERPERPVSPSPEEIPPAVQPVAARGTADAAGARADEEGSGQSVSPIVRRMARDHDIDLSVIAGSGTGGRVTKQDVLAYLASSVASPKRRTWTDEARVEIRPLSIMRKKIAEHMVMSRRTSAHVHSVFHVNFGAVERARRQWKPEYENQSVKLTYLAFVARAAVAALRRFPIVNASLDGDNIVYRKDINLGIAVALDEGLIVPVVKQANELNLLELSRRIADLAGRARAKQLKPDEVHDGTFTITNPGQFGSQFGMPIINQPQVAILCVGTVEQRPIVVDGNVTVATMSYLTLGYDHRLIDGATADQFMAEVKTQIETCDVDH